MHNINSLADDNLHIWTFSSPWNEPSSGKLCISGAERFTHTSSTSAWLNSRLIRICSWCSKHILPPFPRLWRREPRLAPLLLHPACNAAQAWHVTVSRIPRLGYNTLCDVIQLFVCVCRPRRQPPHGLTGGGGVDEVGHRDKEGDGSGRWALCCDVTSWKLLCVVMLHPTEEPSSTASYRPRKRPHEDGRQGRVCLSGEKKKNTVLPLYTPSSTSLSWTSTSLHIHTDVHPAGAWGYRLNVSSS